MNFDRYIRPTDVRQKMQRTESLIVNTNPFSNDLMIVYPKSNRYTVLYILLDSHLYKHTYTYRDAS